MLYWITAMIISVEKSFILSANHPHFTSQWKFNTSWFWVFCKGIYFPKTSKMTSFFQVKLKNWRCFFLQPRIFCFLSQKKTFDMCTVWALWQKIQLMQSPLSFIVFSKFRTWGHKPEFYFIRVHYERVSTALLWYWTSGISNNSTCSLEDLKIKYSTATVLLKVFLLLFSFSLPPPRNRVISENSSAVLSPCKLIL